MSKKPVIRLRLLADEWVVPAVFFGLIFLIVVGVATIIFTLWAFFQLHNLAAGNQAILANMQKTGHLRTQQLTLVLRDLNRLLARRT